MFVTFNRSVQLGGGRVECFSFRPFPFRHQQHQNETKNIFFCTIHHSVIPPSYLSVPLGRRQVQQGSTLPVFHQVSGG